MIAVTRNPAEQAASGTFVSGGPGSRRFAAHAARRDRRRRLRDVRPLIIILLAPLTVFANSLPAAVVTFGSFGWPGSSAAPQAAREELHVSAALMGPSGWFVILRHILPRYRGVLMVHTAMTGGGGVVAECRPGPSRGPGEPPLPGTGGQAFPGARLPRGVTPRQLRLVRSLAGSPWCARLTAAPGPGLRSPSTRPGILSRPPRSGRLHLRARRLGDCPGP